MQIFVSDEPFDLGAVAVAVCASSNFRFAWQFYSSFGCDLKSTNSIRKILDEIADREDLHSFLSCSMDRNDPREFTMERLHAHCSVVSDSRTFLDTMARAMNDRLGAYSRELHASTSAERAPIFELFSKIGEFHAFTTLSGTEADCRICDSHNNDLISSWFFDVAWDYTFIVTWPKRQILWMGCLTDTD